MASVATAGATSCAEEESLWYLECTVRIMQCMPAVPWNECSIKIGT